MTDNKRNELNARIALAMGYMHHDFAELRKFIDKRKLPEEEGLVAPLWCGRDGETWVLPPDCVGSVCAAGALMEWLRPRCYVAIDSTRKGWQVVILLGGDEVGIVRVADTWSEALAVAADKAIERMRARDGTSDQDET